MAQSPLQWIILWAILGVGVAAVLSGRAIRAAQRRLPPLQVALGDIIPRTALEQLTRRALFLMLACTALAVGIVVQAGLAATWASTSRRLTFTALMLVVGAVYAWFQLHVQSWRNRNDGTLDERDEAILLSANAAQGPAVLVTLAAWLVGFIESYQQTRAVPLNALFAVFWSCWVAFMMATLGGILFAARRHGQ